ncbi:mitochondrial protein Pet127-domain-containing protein [Xylariaceae sp. AK1471]|nr:mitochondrial protein Pet127-domain-containing protein [Xylariaceae sp. AK1471]
MLQLGRRRLCRLTSSYVCGSCLVTSHSSSIISRRAIVASHHARPLSTTVVLRDAAIPEDQNALSSKADVVVDNVEPPSPKKKKRKKKKPTDGSLKATPPPANEPLETDAERQLKVLQGALVALKNVLSTQGVDVSQIPITNLEPSTPTATSPAKSKAKAKSKSKSKAAKRGNKNSKADTTPDISNEQVKATTDGAIKSPAADADLKTAPSKQRTGKDHKIGRKRSLRSTLKSQNRLAMSLTPPSVVRRVMQKPSKESKQLKPPRNPFQSGEQKPANLGIPFLGIGKPFTGESRYSSIKPGPVPDKVHPGHLSLVPIETTQLAVPSLSYGLERVLFNPGVYQLQDPRSRVFNFDPYLSEIMPVDEFDFNALKQYVTSSKDTTLISIAKEHQKKYTGSTSSMTSMLAHFHYLLSAWRDINISMLSRGFQPESMQYTRIMKAPAATFLHWKNGTYAIDADKEYDTANILSMLGKSMEKLLTLSKDEYERYRHGNSDQITHEERNAEEAFHYTGFQDFMMRSQLDAYDSRMPGTGMFDLKTRAVVSIRMDAKGYEKGLGYEIRKRFGQWESFEREYYDMIRSAFLKYSLQVRMGRMDGIFVAFHNTQRIFGFQYISLGEMDLALHGTDNTRLGDHEFKVSLKLLNELLNRATQKWPEQSLRLHFETRDSKGAPFMYFFAKPAKPKEIEAVQNAGKASVEAFEKRILGLVKGAAEADVEQPTEADDINDEDVNNVEPSAAEEMESSATWQEARQMVEEAMDDDELGLGLVREAIGDALEQSGILRARSSAESREYVDALIGAITGRTQADLSTIGANEEELVDEKDSATTENKCDSHPDLLGTEISSVPSEGIFHLSQPTAHVHETQARDSQTTAAEDTKEVTTAASPASKSMDAEEESEEADDYEEEGEPERNSDIEAKEPREDVGSSSLKPLKGLIMRMARRIDERSVSDADINSSQDDASKLKDFERILERLISQSRTEQLEGKSGDDVADQTTSSEYVPSDDVVAGKSESNEATTSLDAQGQETAQPATIKEPSQPDEGTQEPELLCLTLTIKNKVNGTYVDRPDSLRKDDDWTVEYEIQEAKASRARKIYMQMIERRRKVFSDTGDKENEWYKMFHGNLEKFTEQGRKYRKQEEQTTEGQPMHMVGTEGPLRWGDVFRRQPKNVQTSDEDHHKRSTTT